MFGTYSVVNVTNGGDSVYDKIATIYCCYDNTQLFALYAFFVTEIVRKQRKNGVENTARVLSTTDKPAATAIICLFGL